MKIRTDMKLELTIGRLGRFVEVVDLNPPYQREGGVWSTDVRGKLIDSIINGLDLPKLYFEKEMIKRSNPAGLSYQYAVIDGKQRLEAILSFLAGDLRLPEDFRFFEDETIKAAAMTFPQLSEKYPGLARRVLDYQLPIVRVTSDSGDLIEEMFQRLNASSALNAAEKRNSLTGPTRDAANDLAAHALLVTCSPIRSARYKYRELGAKFLAIERQVDEKRRIVDTKADTLYQLFTATRGVAPKISADKMEGYREQASKLLDKMASVFVADDPLLASIGTVVVYYIAFRNDGPSNSIDRLRLQQFELLRREAGRMSEDSPGYARPANARLREYNAFVQSTNDGRALERRAEILLAYTHGYSSEDPLVGLDEVPDGELPDFDSEAS
jgi:hypothetical protein